jgi:hypothetical protein
MSVCVMLINRLKVKMVCASFMIAFVWYSEVQISVFIK